MQKWLGRLGRILFLLVWLLVMIFPVVAFLLATQQQVQLGEADGRHLRLFLIQEDDAGGVGVEWTRRAGADCLRTSIGYLLWSGDEDQIATSYCQCVDGHSAALQTRPLADCR